MSKNHDELNEFIDKVTDGAYNLPCVEVIFKFVKQTRSYVRSVDAAMGRRENQENSGCTSCRRDQDLHRR